MTALAVDPMQGLSYTDVLTATPPSGTTDIAKVAV